MLNLTAGVYNIETESIEALLNIHPDAFMLMPNVYSNSTVYAFWVKNTQTGEISIITANKNIRDVRNSITTLLS